MREKNIRQKLSLGEGDSKRGGTKSDKTSRKRGMKKSSSAVPFRGAQGETLGKKKNDGSNLPNGSREKSLAIECKKPLAGPFSSRFRARGEWGKRKGASASPVRSNEEKGRGNPPYR